MRFAYLPFKRRLLAAVTIAVILVTAIQMGSMRALLSDYEHSRMNVQAGVWNTSTPTPTQTSTPEAKSEHPPQAGTTLSADAAAEGFMQENGDDIIYGVRGSICVTNDGEIPTEGLKIVTAIQIKKHKGQFENYISEPFDVSPRPYLTQGETNCYPFEIVYKAFTDEDVEYRFSALVTITNHSGWLPGGNHCEGDKPCPFGPEVKTDFKLPTPSRNPSTEMPTPSATPTFTQTPTEPTPAEAPVEIPPTQSPSETPTTDPPTGEPTIPIEPPSTDPPTDESADPPESPPTEPPME